MRKTIVMLFLCIAASLLNLAINKLCLLVDFPLYLDTVLTVSVTLLYGPVWGSLTGALTNIIANTLVLDVYGWASYLFALCNIATALLTWLFVRFFMRELGFEASVRQNKVETQNLPGPNLESRRLDTVMNRLIVLVFLAFVLCIAMSILGGLISAFIQFLLASSGSAQPNPAATQLSSTLFSRQLPVVAVEILSRIPINIIDRLITVFAAYGIAKAVSRLRKPIFHLQRPHNSPY